MLLFSLWADAVRFTTAFTLELCSAAVGQNRAIASSNQEEEGTTVTTGGGSASTSSEERKSLNLFEETDPMLDVSSLVYPVVELRKVVTGKLKKLQQREGLSNSSVYPALEDNDLDSLRNEMERSKRLSKAILEKAGAAGSSSGKKADDAELKKLKDEYSESQKGLEGLMARFHLTESDVKIIGHKFDLLSLPKTSSDVKSDLTINADYISLFLVAFGGEDFNIESLLSIVDREESPSILDYIDDDFEVAGTLGFTSELVYAITINEELKRITVVFRGSVVANDWITNIQLNTTPLDLPGPCHPTPDTNYGRVHEGFYKYLFGPTKKGRDGRDISKSDAIMGRLEALFAKYPDYKLYVTGHSLGGALSTLMSFRAALSNAIPKPVTNVSFASPYVGNQEFRDAFQHLEGEKKLRHVRISNEDDVVPLIPAVSYFGMRYKHVGMNIKLYNRTWWRNYTHRIFYPKVGGSIVDELGRAINSNFLLGLTLKVLPNHLCPEYRERFDNAKEELEKLDLDRDLYGDDDLVGDLFSQYHD